MSPCLRYTLIFLLAITAVTPLYSQSATVPEKFYSEMRWRMIGPHRGGRVLAVSGVRGQPNTFYFGAVGGGVWKTTDAGRTWNPIFDSQPIASIGALAVSTSNPNVIYVGSGEADMRSDISYGNGMYKSSDGGKTWSHLGLDDTRQIGRVLIDPKDSNVVLVAALGHGFGPNSERGVFRTTDGGKTWAKVLYKDENTGAIDLAFDPNNAQTVFASLWNVRRPAWNAYAPITGPGGGIYKSTDGGVTWNQIAGKGLPEGKLGRIGLDVGAGTHGQTIYALIDAERSSGLYRSTDGGQTWTLLSTDSRILSRGWYFGEVRLHPKNPQTVYVSNVSLYLSSDGGKTFAAIRGAPGGDDYHSLWIVPENPDRMISGVDQGTLITVNGGRTWSSWYNQPTAQFYHVAVDNRFPYNVYGAQQDSGTASVASRSDYGQITFRDWHPVGAGESGYIAPDPVNPDIVYGGSTGGEMYRYNNKTKQVQDVSPTPATLGSKVGFRYPWTTPIAFSAHSPQALYQSSQFLFKTTDGGNHWEIISPDLTVRPGDNEADAQGVIYTIAPSPARAGTIWIGTDNGLIQLTRDEGKTWNDVSPEGLPPWSMMSIIDASPHDAATAYVAVDRHQMDDIQPHIFRTHDYGASWTKIVTGLPGNGYVHVVREDPKRRGLLFAGTELGVYVSFDDGDHWQSLQLNLPVCSVRDLVVKDNDLVIATHGRSFWILDDISPLRQVSREALTARAYLVKPATAVRVRKNQNKDTPLPPETPAGQNPPAGAIIDYFLQATPAGELTLEIRDAKGDLVRKFSSSDPVEPPDHRQAFPTYWFRPSASLSRRPGHNRFVWDLRYERPQALHFGYSIAAAFGEDAIMLPEGPLVLPGTYQLRLTSGGQSVNSSLEVKEDPRVKLAPGALEEQLALAKKITSAMAETHQAVMELRALREKIKAMQPQLTAKSDLMLTEQVKVLDDKAQVLIGGPPRFPPSNETSLSALNDALASILVSIDSSDTAPAKQFVAAFDTYQTLVTEKLFQLKQLKETDLLQLNPRLRRSGLPELNN